MKQIWAPWRKAYILGHKKSRGCIFCRALRASAKDDPKNLILIRSKYSFTILNLYPYNNGHLMVVPNRHVATLDRLRNEERLDLLKVMDQALAVLKKSLRPQAFNVGMNLGRIAGAGVPDHIHIHIVPRWKGDTNFMPVLSDTRVISDSLAATYKHLRRLIKN